jgi:D-3-phosphoglycerate dehydrogenase
VLSLRGRTQLLGHVRATAEHTIALMLALLRHLPEAAAHARSGRWRRDDFRGRELHGAAVGIVGLGRLGRIVSRTLLAFEARVFGYDPSVPEGAEPEGVTLVSLPELLRRAEIVSLHASLTADSEGLLGAKEIESMHDGAFLVNTARGELVDEAALLAALESGRLAGAALDVLADENPAGMPDRPLVRYAATHSNLIITPHIGGCTHESMEKTEVFMAETLVAHLGEGRS